MTTFPHPCGVLREHPGLAILGAVFDNPALAYAFYFMVLEMVYSAPACALAVNEVTVRVLARRLGIKPAKVAEMSEAAAAAGLFDEDAYRAGTITNRTIRKNAAATYRRRQLERARHRRKSAARTEPETPISTG